MARLGFFAKGALVLPGAAVCAAAAIGVAACSASNGGSGFGPGGGDPGGGGSASTSSNDGGGGSIFSASGGNGPGSGGGTPGDCSEAAKLIYIIGEGNNFYSFYPPTLEVTQIGVVNCPQNGGFATPFSMAVDRTGRAWVLFSDGKIYHLDVTNAACTASPFQPNQQGLSLFGMGFVSDTPGSQAETLYVADYYGEGIAPIDTESYVMGAVKPYDTLFAAAELTGTGDARLFGFFQNSPIIIAEINKATGQIISQAPQPTINIGSGWAYAFWGGDFWLFTSPTGDSQIDRYQPSAGTTTTVKTGIGDNIVGAGVSTCAPTEPPE